MLISGSLHELSFNYFFKSLISSGGLRCEANEFTAEEKFVEGCEICVTRLTAKLEHCSSFCVDCKTVCVRVSGR